MAPDDARPSRNGPTGHLQRVPPHDTQTEQHLLGAALLRKDAADIVAGVNPSDFYTPTHATIAEVIVHLVGTDTAVDPGTVAAELRARGQLDSISLEGRVGASYLVFLQSNCPAIGSAPTYAAWVQRYARQRRMLTLAGDLADAVYRGVATEGLVAEMVAATEAGLVGMESSWDLVNLADTLAGVDGEERPIFLQRTDGVPLLYPGKVHAFNAESETGKSMLAVWACAERLLAGEHVGYIDFEDSARGVIDRLLGFGIPPATALERFHYIRPDDPIDGGARLRVREMLRVFPLSLVVIDGVAEALALSGWDENAASDIATFFNSLPRAISREGVAVILIDHLVKDKEKQGNDARGSGAKRAGIDGASFKLEVIRPFVRGGQGIAKVVLTKDRPGWVRPAAVGKTIAEMHLSSDEGSGALSCELRPPSSAVDEEGHFRPTWLMARVSEALAGAPGPVSRNWVVERVGKRKAQVLKAVSVLIDEGYVREVERALVLVRAYRDESEPLPEPPEDDEPHYTEGDEPW